VERRSERVRSVDDSRARWWRPESLWGRALLVLGALAVVGGGAVAALLLNSALQSDDRFRIAGADNIETVGLAEVTRADLLPIFGEDIGKNIFFIDLQQHRHEIEAIPWVKHATVMRMLPNRLRVSIEERKPVAFTQINGETGLVDADGVLLSMSPAAMAERHYTFPVVTGLSPTAKPDERHARMNVYMAMMNELDAGGQHNSLQISEVDLSDAEDARVKMVDQSADIVAHLGYEHFLVRYQRYMRHIAEWRQQYPRLIGVDLRYKVQTVLKLAPAGTPLSGDGQQLAGPQSPQNPKAAQPPVQLAKGQSPAPTTQSRQQLAAKSGQKGPTADNHSTASRKNAAARAANQRAGRDKTGKPKAEQGRADRTHTDKQRAREVVHRPAMNTARHTAPPVRSASAAEEGQ
jgi:cell division protein FtsQ